MPRLQIVGQAPRGFGDDLKTARHGIDRARIDRERFVIETRRKPRSKIDVMRDVAQRGNRGIRTHKSRRYYGGANVGLQPLAADNIDPAVEQTGDVAF